MVFCSILLAVFLFLEFYYFLRIFISIVYINVLVRLRGIRKADDEGTVYGICTTTDLDFLCHMNNTRYLREMDFARVDFFGQNGLYKAARDVGGTMVMSATSIRYRRSVTLFQVFRIRTKLLFWDDRNFYVEHRLETVHDNFVRAVALAKQTLVGLSANDALKAAYGTIPEPPELTAEVKSWMESNDMSSKRFRQEARLNPNSQDQQNGCQQNLKDE